MQQNNLNSSSSITRPRGHWLPWIAGGFALAGCAGTAEKNSLLPATGSLPARIQTTTLKKNETKNGAVLSVEKSFPNLERNKQ